MRHTNRRNPILPSTTVPTARRILWFNSAIGSMLEILLLIYFCRYSNSLSFVFVVFDWFHHHVGRGADRRWSLDMINKDKPSPHLNHVRYTLLPSRPLSSLGGRHSRCHHRLLHLWRSEQAMRCLPNLLWRQTRQ